MGRLGDVLGLDEARRSAVQAFAERADVPVDRLRQYLEHERLPPLPDLDKLCAAAGVSPIQVRLALGRIDRELAELLARNYSAVVDILDGQSPDQHSSTKAQKPAAPDFRTRLGRLYRGDCIELLPTIASEIVDMVFADPPFNLKKLYPSRIDDDLKESRYLDWTEEWLRECVRVLRPGGSLFVWNLPKWNTYIATLLNQTMTFRHWIAVDIKYSLPIGGRLYPSHYSLLYYTKGPAPKTFHPDRLPMEICPHCFGDLRDYGGYKDKMNPRGVNLTDIWFDIPPVRHAKYKRRKDANELSLRLMDRVVELASDPGDLVLDPFGGSGTTYVACELKKRCWIGMELGPIDGIVGRLKDLADEKAYLDKIRRECNHLFVPEARAERTKRGLWTAESLRNSGESNAAQVPFQLEG